MEQINRQVRKAQRQLALNRFVRVLGWCWFVTLLIAAALIVLDKFRPTGVQPWIWGAGAVGLGVLAAAFWAATRGRGPIDAAIEIDRRFRLKERVSSALAMSDQERETPLGQALVDDAERRVRRIDLSEHFAISPGRQLLLPLIPAAIAVLVALFLPAAANSRAQANTDPKVKEQIENSSKDLRRKLVEKRKRAQEQGLKDAEELFKRLEEGTDDLPDRSKGQVKQAMVKLNDLARQIKDRRQELGGADQVRQQLDQLKSIERGPADEFLKAVKQGDFGKAIEELEKLKAKVAEGNLDDQQRQQLAKQLDQMQEKLQKLVDAHRQAQEDLEKRINQARQEGRGADADNLQQQLDALRQQMPQMNQLQNLAEKLGKCGQCLRDNQLQEAGDMLDNVQADVASLQEQLGELDMLNEALGQLAQCRDQMNCPQCQGRGCGACQGKIPGVGLGAGRGKGDRPEEENDVSFYDTRATVKTGQGSASVVGEVDGRNYRGDVQLEMHQQYQAARRQSADPVTVQHLPRGYQEHALDYLDRLREGK
ncbi:MAG: hypothetical protein A2V98_20195 [Planctomycetes bacterium RBG_16_64_12]|nr:MAG: hypothetical protein A2V98_20195 [Planctomycetes bacterium RBG_16_64_12]